jgi:hypothetical protein
MRSIVLFVSGDSTMAVRDDWLFRFVAAYNLIRMRRLIELAKPAV